MAWAVEICLMFEFILHQCRACPQPEWGGMDRALTGSTVKAIKIQVPHPGKIEV
jgi:hypothetical protein